MTAPTVGRRRGGAAPAGTRRPAGRVSQQPRRARGAADGARAAQRPSRAGSALDRARGLAEAAGRARVPLIALAIVAVVLVTLYGPAKDLYCAWREQGASQQTLDELNASIDEYQSDIDRLQTREGIEDEARKRGYVEEGESGVTATGLPEEGGEDVAEESLPWYLSLGDVVFQYQEEQ